MVVVEPKIVKCSTTHSQEKNAKRKPFKIGAREKMNIFLRSIYQGIVKDRVE